MNSPFATEAEEAEARALFVKIASAADPVAATIWERRVDGARWSDIAAEVDLSVEETKRRVRRLVATIRTALDASLAADAAAQTGASR